MAFVITLAIISPCGFASESPKARPRDPHQARGFSRPIWGTRRDAADPQPPRQLPPSPPWPASTSTIAKGEIVALIGSNAPARLTVARAVRRSVAYGVKSSTQESSAKPNGRAHCAWYRAGTEGRGISRHP